ncbi:TPA: DUF550 domain-containing protein [Klebsiella pneumoniae]|nr:DUF550 domain-containing protein [Klebsiella pneumoniae]MBG2007802.1 DUF550 domain-containing protein [Klebsiella pneumoniae]MBG2435058.1 DUF550 domain-containing protein [Klebsiella pneumoniae]HBQ7796429.1 DUF550 domain-containing protein [Klebsiella pneumoniae]
MTKSTITRERIAQIANPDAWVKCTHEEVQELAHIALAAMDSEPVAFTEKHEISNMHATGLYLRAWPADRARNSVEGYTIPLYTTPQPISLVNSEPVAYIFKHPAGRLFWALTDESNKGQNDVMPVYASPQPAPERDRVRREHAEWSQATFGNVGPVGPLKHLSKEALEAAEQPGDLSEWADMQFLLWDAQRRAGITDEQITQAMIDKLAVNKQREWPEPKDGEPRLHIKSQPAPVITFYRDGIEAAAKWIDQQREAYDSEHGWSDPDTGAFEFGNDAQRGYSSTLEELAEGIRALHPNAGNSPVITDRWIPVSEKLPERGDYLVSDGRDFDVQLFNGEQFIPGFVWEDKITHWMPLPATPQEVK